MKKGSGTRDQGLGTKNRRGLLFLVFCFFFSFSSQAKVTDRIVAVVNNDVVTQHELERAMTLKSAGAKHSTNPEEEGVSLRRQVLDQLINDKLLQQEIAKNNIEVNDDDLARAIANVLQKNHINIEVLRAELAAKGIPFEEYKEQLKTQIRQAKFMQQNLTSQVQVSDLDIENYKSGRISVENQKVVAHLASIDLSASEASTKEIQSLVLKARKITDRARKGEDFAKLAKHYSEGPQAKEGGDLGTKPLGELPPAVAAQVLRMEKGAVSDPIVTPKGVTVVKLFEKSGQTPPTKTTLSDDQIREQIYNERMEQEMNNYLAKLRRKAYIDIRE